MGVLESLLSKYWLVEDNLDGKDELPFSPFWGTIDEAYKQAEIFPRRSIVCNLRKVSHALCAHHNHVKHIGD